MNLIDYFIKEQISICDSQCNSSYIDANSTKINQNIIQNILQKISIKKHSLNGWHFALQRYQQLYLLCLKSSFNSISNEFNFGLCLVKDQLVKCSILYEKILLIRFLLNLNFKHIGIVYKINPINGQLAFKNDFLIPEYIFIPENQVEQLIFLSIFNLKLGVNNEFKNIRFYLQSESQVQQQDETVSNVFLKQIKKFINHSNKYAWKILRGKTQNFQKQQKKMKYINLKQEFMNSNKYQITNPLITYLTQVFNVPLQTIQSFDHLQLHQDDRLKENHLLKPCIRKQFKLINQITVQQQCFERQISNIQPKMQTLQFGSLNFSVTKQKPIAITYTKQILNKLPSQQFMGLPKFYFIKNLKKQTANILLTNLYESISYKNFLFQNNRVLSNNTKFYMINQIILTIKYLRDHGVVFLNLRPEQIFIKKGFKLKLYGFRNAYHQQVLLPQYSPYKNIFPYVASYNFGKNKTYDDQRTDVYSLGVLIFETLFQKCHWHIKDTFKICLNIYQLYQKYQNQPIFALQKLNGSSMLILKLITNFILRSIKVKIVTENYQQNHLKRKICFSQRPYLDWMIIIIRHIMTYYQFIL